MSQNRDYHACIKAFNEQYKDVLPRNNSPRYYCPSNAVNTSGAYISSSYISSSSQYNNYAAMGNVPLYPSNRKSGIE